METSWHHSTFTLLFLSTLLSAQESRDPWLWPFASTSIWNTPIGSDAQYHPVTLRQGGHVGADIQFLLELRTNNPVRQVLESPTWGPGRCSGTEAVGTLQFPIPDSFIVPDAGPTNPYGLTPNANFVFRLTSPDSIFEGSKIARCDTAGPLYLPDFYKWPNNVRVQSLYGDGLQGGGQGASGMSALGGTIRLGELTGLRPFRHAIKLNPWGRRDLFYSAGNPGYRWPAVSADNYAASPTDGYAGTDPELVMGSLLAIPPTVDSVALNLTTEPSRRLFWVLKHFGAYFTEDAAWDTWDLIVERGAEEEFHNAFGFSMSSVLWKSEVNKLVSALAVVANNSPTSIGGGGTPLTTLAPPIDEIPLDLRSPTHPSVGTPGKIPGKFDILGRTAQ